RPASRLAAGAVVARRGVPGVRALPVRPAAPRAGIRGDLVADERARPPPDAGGRLPRDAEAASLSARPTAPESSGDPPADAEIAVTVYLAASPFANFGRDRFGHLRSRTTQKPSQAGTSPRSRAATNFRPARRDDSSVVDIIAGLRQKRTRRHPFRCGR